MTVKIGTYKGPTNKIQKSDLITWNSEDFECTVRDSAGMNSETPKITLALSGYTGSLTDNINYAAVDGFGYFFVDSIDIVRNGLYTLNLRRDYLMTYRAQILASKAYIKRSESAYDLYYNDPSITTYAYKTIDCKRLTTSAFDTTSHYIAIIVGE